MKVPKRSQPMVFELAEEELAASLASDSTAVGGLGFRLPSSPVANRPITIHGAEMAVTPSEPEVEASAFESGEDERQAPGWPIWLIATAASALWALAPVAFAIGYRSNVAPLQNDQFAMAVFALLAFGPAVFVFCAAYVIRQGQKLAYEARRAKAMAEEMVTPALVAAARAGHLARAVRDEITRAGTAAGDAREALLALRDALAFETDKLTGATAQSVRTAHELSATLGRERGEMSSLAQTLDVQATRVTDAIGQQAKMVAEAAGVAETQIREAEVGLSARAADLAAAAGAAGDAARTAGEDLTRHIARLEAAGTGVAEQVSAVESGLTDHRITLVSLSQTLKSDHDSFVANAGAHAEQLGEFISAARESAQALHEQATVGGEVVREFVADASLQLRDLVETAKAEREEFGQSTLHSLEAVSSAAALQRAQLETDTRAAVDALASAAEANRQAAASHTAVAREQVDQLSEAAFNAGHKANQIFEARLEEARALVEASSKMVDAAGDASAARLEAGAAVARATLEDLTAMMGELEARATRLPEVARGQIDDVRAAVAQGLEDLIVQARQTAEETQALDTAIQARLRHNLETLAELSRRAETAATAPPAADALPVDINPPQDRADLGPPPLELGTPLNPEPQSGVEPAERIGLRTRIRLTPIATDAEFSAVFETAAGTPASKMSDDAESDAGAGEPWTWKDLLASLDGSDGELGGLDELLAADLAKMGVEPEKLLPMARVQEVSAAVQTGDVDGARQVVRKLAPAATRRIARRMFTDDDVKRRTALYVGRYKLLVDDAIMQDPAGRRLEALLCSDAGRVFLLLDTAAGDMI